MNIKNVRYSPHGVTSRTVRVEKSVTHIVPGRMYLRHRYSRSIDLHARTSSFEVHASHRDHGNIPPRQTLDLVTRALPGWVSHQEYTVIEWNVEAVLENYFAPALWPINKWTIIWKSPNANSSVHLHRWWANRYKRDERPASQTKMGLFNKRRPYLRCVFWKNNGFHVF